MLTSREIASLIIIGAFVLTVALAPRLGRDVGPHLRSLLVSIFARPLVVVYAIVLAASATSTALAWWIGLWDWSLLKDTLIITATVVLPMTGRCSSSPAARWAKNFSAKLWG